MRQTKLFLETSMYDFLFITRNGLIEKMENFGKFEFTSEAILLKRIFRLVLKKFKVFNNTFHDKQFSKSKLAFRLSIWLFNP